MFKFNSDIKKYKRYSNKSGFILLLTQQGLWALFVYRINSAVYKSAIPRYLKNFLLIFCVISQKWIEIIAGISIPYSAEIGHSLYIGHFGNIIINANAVIGNDCNISQGVTIGVSGRDDKRGVPVIGNNVYIGANATVAGKIYVNNNSVVAANSLVINDVKEGTTVLGVPAKAFNTNNSRDYIL
jgi:serine O-acetyltransferase